MLMRMNRGALAWIGIAVIAGMAPSGTWSQQVVEVAVEAVELQVADDIGQFQIVAEAAPVLVPLAVVEAPAEQALGPVPLPATPASPRPTAVADAAAPESPADDAQLNLIEAAVLTSVRGKTPQIPDVLTHASKTRALEQTLLIPRGAEWRYWSSAEEPPAEWNLLDFSATDDWAVGAAPLGYGQSGMKTTLSFGEDADSKHLAAFFRTEFQVTGAIVDRPVLCQIQNDDGAIVYLNGKEVFRRNMPSGVPTMQTAALVSTKPETRSWPEIQPVCHSFRHAERDGYIPSRRHAERDGNVPITLRVMPSAVMMPCAVMILVWTLSQWRNTLSSRGA